MNPLACPHRFGLSANTAVLLAACLGYPALAQTTAPANTFPPDTQTLSPQALQERLAGKKFTSRYANGMTATLQYGADQSLQLDMSTGLSARGIWRVEGAQICMQVQAGIPSGCGESKATATHIYLKRYTNQEVIQLQELASSVPAANTLQRASLRPAFTQCPPIGRR